MLTTRCLVVLFLACSIISWPRWYHVIELFSYGTNITSKWALSCICGDAIWFLPGMQGATTSCLSRSCHENIVGSSACWGRNCRTRDVRFLASVSHCGSIGKFQEIIVRSQIDEIIASILLNMILLRFSSSAGIFHWVLFAKTWLRSNRDSSRIRNQVLQLLLVAWLNGIVIFCIIPNWIIAAIFFV